jgi:hypothetical protein
MGNPNSGTYSGLVIGGPLDGKICEDASQIMSVPMIAGEPITLGPYEKGHGAETKIDIFNYVWNPVYMSPDGSETIYVWVPQRQGRAETIKKLIAGYAPKKGRGQ